MQLFAPVNFCSCLLFKGYWKWHRLTFIVLLLLTHCSTKPPYPNLFKASLFTPSNEVSIAFKFFLAVFSHPIQGRPAFRLTLDGQPKKANFGGLSSFFRKTTPNHFNPFVIFFLHFFCLKYSQSNGYPKLSLNNSPGKHVTNPLLSSKEPIFQNCTWTL